MYIPNQLKNLTKHIAHVGNKFEKLKVITTKKKKLNHFQNKSIMFWWKKFANMCAHNGCSANKRKQKCRSRISWKKWAKLKIKEIKWKISYGFMTLCFCFGEQWNFQLRRFFEVFPEAYKCTYVCLFNDGSFGVGFDGAYT